jgi:hypothetical protein
VEGAVEVIVVTGKPVTEGPTSGDELVIIKWPVPNGLVPGLGASICIPRLAFQLSARSDEISTSASVWYSLPLPLDGFPFERVLIPNLLDLDPFFPFTLFMTITLRIKKN